MTTHKEALTALVNEMEYVLSCINADKVPFDGDDFHEALRLGKEALMSFQDGAQQCVCGEPNTAGTHRTDGPCLAPQPEQESVEDLQAKLKWATERLEANINWEVVAFAKEEMLKAAWAEIKELRQEPKIHIESGMTADELWLSNGKLRAKLADLKVQRKPLMDEQIVPMFRAREKMKVLGEKDAWFWYAWGIGDAEAAHGIKE